MEAHARTPLLIAFLALLAALFVPWAASATPVTGELFYTRFSGAPNVKSVSFDFDGSTFTLEPPVAIGNTPGADGIAGNPKNSDLLIVAGQGNDISTISKSTGAVNTVSSPVSAFHVEVPNPGVVLASGIPDGLARHPINPGGSLGAGTAISLSGDTNVVTQIISTPSGFFYTASGPGGFGSFGRIRFNDLVESATAAVTTELLSGVPAAHGGVYDPFTDNIVLMGDDEITQLSLIGTTISNRNFAGFGGVDPNFDQGTVDGDGHLFAASNSGHLLFVDYASTGLIGDPSNFAALPFLDSALDDVAPLVGPGRTTDLPAPATLALIGIGLAGLGMSRRRNRERPALAPSGELPDRPGRPGGPLGRPACRAASAMRCLAGPPVLGESFAAGTAPGGRRGGGYA